MMKLSMVLLAVVLIAGTEAQRGNSLGNMFSPKKVMGSVESVLENALKFVRRSQGPEDTLRNIGETVADFIPCMEPKMDKSDKMLYVYEKYMCTAANCKWSAPMCMNAMSMPNKCQNFKACIPDALESIVEGVNPMEVMEQCMMARTMTDLDLGYDWEDFEGNVRMIVGSMFRDGNGLPEDTNMEVNQALNSTCLVPKRDDCIKKAMFKMCLMNTCVNSMATTFDFEE